MCRSEWFLGVCTIFRVSIVLVFAGTPWNEIKPFADAKIGFDVVQYIWQALILLSIIPLVQARRAVSSNRNLSVVFTRTAEADRDIFEGENLAWNDDDGNADMGCSRKRNRKSSIEDKRRAGEVLV